jgi:hypothetical protein
MALSLEEMLALLPDNTTGEIDAADLRAIITSLSEITTELDTRLAAVEAGGSGGDSFSVTGVWQVNPTPNAQPQGGQMTADTVSFAAATLLRFAKIDKLNQDSAAALLNSTAIFMQERMDSSNWVTYDVTGTPSEAGGVISVPVTSDGSSGVHDAAAWQEAAVVLNVRTSAAYAQQEPTPLRHVEAR